MKSTENFKKVIQDYINEVSKEDPEFAEKVKNPKKNIDDCITYILNTVKKSGCNGFEDQEIFGMAVHYYDEENIKPGNKITGQVVVNHKIELTPEDIEKAKKEAKDKLIQEEMDRIRRKSEKPKKTAKEIVEPTLFD